MIMLNGIMLQESETLFLFTVKELPTILYILRQITLKHFKSTNQ
jgi:hypothetical protein